jgi:Homeodomain-like domain
MRTGRPVTPLQLTRDERRELTKVSRQDGGATKREAMRARIILAAAGQRRTPAMTGKQIAALLAVSQQTVSLWRRRFARARLAAMVAIHHQAEGKPRRRKPS